MTFYINLQFFLLVSNIKSSIWEVAELVILYNEMPIKQNL